MTIVLPPPVGLTDPPGDPDTLSAAADEFAGAGFVLGVVTAHLVGPTMHASGWLGEDAAAAADELVTCAHLVATLHDAVTTAQGVLEAHADLLVTTRARLVVLRSEQEDGFAEAERRLFLLVDPAAQMSSAVDPPGARAVIVGVEQAESDRAVEHQQLLDDVAEAAVLAGAQLATATAPWGASGSGGADSGLTVRFQLAAALPGHGYQVLLGLGREVAGDLTTPGTAGQVLVVAQDNRELLAHPVVAGAAVVALGVDGLHQLLIQAGSGDAELAAILAMALGAAGRAGERVPGAAPILAGVLDADDRDGTQDQVALGLGAVLSAPAVPVGLAALWLGPLLARERAQGARVVDRMAPAGADPVDIAVSVLADADRPDASVGVLADDAVWELLLGRVWTDGGAVLAELVATAGAGAGSGAVVTAALSAVGAQLEPGGDLVVTVVPATWARVAPALTEVAVDHVDVLLQPLADPQAPGAAGVLAGLTMLIAAPAQRASVRTAVLTEVTPGASGGAGQPPASAAATIGALVSVEDQAGRLVWTLGVSEAVERAAVNQLWYGLLTFPAPFVVGPLGPLVRGAVEMGAWAFHAHGVVELPSDREVPVGPNGAAA